MTLRELLTDEHLNSRFVYLITSLTVCASVAYLVVMFSLAARQEYYPELIGILLAGGVGSSAGRWMTSKKLKAALGEGNVETKEVTTVEKSIKKGKR